MATNKAKDKQAKKKKKISHLDHKTVIENLYSHGLAGIATLLVAQSLRALAQDTFVMSAGLVL